MKVYGKLEVAQLEWFTNAGKPAASSYPYRVIFVTDVGSGQVQVSDGSSWIAAGSGSGGGSAFDTLVQKAINEQYGILSADLDYSAILSGKLQGVSNTYSGTLLSQATAAASTIEIVWNAMAVNGSDKNIDSTTNWSATNAGNTLTTSGTAKVGTASLSFQKNGTSTEAGIRYDVGSQDQILGANTRVYYYINLPTVTGVSNVGLRIYADNTSNYRTWTTTTNSQGAALATGWNLCYFDISTGGTASGSGWTYTSRSRYQEIFVTTAVAGTTLAATLVDSFYFGATISPKLGVIGSEFTLFDTTNKENIVIASSNTQPDGVLTLASALTNTYVGGLSVTARGRVLRHVMTVDGTNQINFNNDTSFAGAITTAQELRFGNIYRQSVSKSYQAFVDVIPAQRYEISGSITGTTFKVTDTADEHLNLLSGDTVEIFRPTYIDGNIKYYLLMSTALTANSTYSSSETTLTVSSTTGLAVGDVVCKRPFTSVSLSAVSTPTTNESFSALTLDSNPDGIQLLGDFKYPNESSVYMHFTLGDISSSEATRNRKGSTSISLTTNGTLNVTDSFLRGRYSASGFNGSGGTATNYYSLSPSASARELSGDSGDCTRVQVSFWFYDSTGFDGNERYMVCNESAGADGWMIAAQAASNNMRLIFNNGGFYTLTGSYSTGTWVHVFADIVDNSTSSLYLNGSLVGTTSGNITASGTHYFNVGKRGANNSGTNGLRIADLIVWRNGTAFTQAQLDYLYNRGSYRNSTKPELVRYRYTANAQSGQKVSMKVSGARSTTAVTPMISKLGFIGS